MSATEVGGVCMLCTALALLAQPVMDRISRKLSAWASSTSAYKLGDNGVIVPEDILPILMWFKNSPGVTEVKASRPVQLSNRLSNLISIGFSCSEAHLKEMTKIIRTIENYTRQDVAFLETRIENDVFFHVIHFYDKSCMRLFIERGPVGNLKQIVKT